MFTQIGSSPQTSVRLAIKDRLRYPIPALPELPLLGDSMVDDIGQSRKPAGLQKFKENEFSRAKIQCAGPVTLFRTGKYSLDDAVVAACEYIKVLLDGLCADQIILFLDEPGLDKLPVELDYELAWSSIFDEFDVTSGIHTCGDANWERLFRSGVNIISLDATRVNLPVLFPEYRKYGAVVAWGVQHMRDIRDFQKGDLLTYPCGMSPLAYKPIDCEIAFNKLNFLSQRLLYESNFVRYNAHAI
ncbi:MAG: hypothetical protein ACKUBY_04045 [Candidatus Moraniibacteriota bacterium]|jgi:hypothetical protein